MPRSERARITLECLDELKKEREKAERERVEANKATTIKIKE